MKQFFKRLLFGNQPARQYLTLSIYEEDIQEKAFLHINDKIRIEVTKYQFVLCQKPFIIGIWIQGFKEFNSSKFALNITDSEERNLVKLKLKVIQSFFFETGSFVMFRLTHSAFYFIAWLHQKLLVSYFYFNKQNKVSFSELNSFCAAYTFPRKVILTCFGQSNDYNLFPMDLQGYVDDASLYILGLRNTNVTLQKILSEKKVVVCDLSASDKEQILKLGNHHSRTPPSPEVLPFNFKKTAVFQTPVPDIAKSYKEIQITTSMNMGSHTIMIGKVINQTENQDKFPGLYHLHVAPAITSSNPYIVV